jgi:RTX calcium-binding nonapeptide repeat (4 copies)/Lipase (class 3)
MTSPTASDIQGAAFLATAAYDDHPNVPVNGPTWRAVDLHDIVGTTNIEANIENHFLFRNGNGEAFLAYNQSTNTVCVAFRGTENILTNTISGARDLFNDVTAGLLPNGFASYALLFDKLVPLAEQYANSLGARLMFTGHSLGGAAAEIWQHKTVGSIGVTFGSPGQYAGLTAGNGIINFGQSNDWVYNRVATGGYGSDVTIDLGNVREGWGSNDHGQLILNDIPLSLIELGSHYEEHKMANYGQSIGAITSSELFGSFILDPGSYRVVIGDRPSQFPGPYYFFTPAHDRVDDTIDASLFGYRSFILGGFGSDTITGGTGDDLIDGGWSDDTLYGGAGADQIAGGKGNDVLSGQSGKDTLFGGSNADRFIFGGLSIGDANAGVFDSIKDYSAGEGDVIDISAITGAAFAA